MIIRIEVLKSKIKAMKISLIILTIINTAFVVLSFIGGYSDKINKINSSPYNYYYIFAFVLAIIPFIIFISSGLRFINLAYRGLEEDLFIYTSYYPEFFCVALITPVINWVYPFIFMKELIEKINHKKNIWVYAFTAFFYCSILIFLLDGSVKGINYIKDLHNPIDLIAVLWLFYFNLGGFLLYKFLDDVLKSANKAYQEYLSI
jgi:hypothetical protein